MCESVTSLVTKEAPDFTAKAVMPDDSFADVTLSSHRGKYVVLFFYPLDFTFVCPSEIIAFHKAVKEFEERNTVVLGCSVDSEYSHWAWRQTPPNKGGIGKVDFPLIADLNKSIARSYGVLFDESVALRGLFLIDTHGVVRHALVNDLPLGRSVAEAIRTLDALQFVEEHGDVCPANWQKGEKAMTPTADGVAEYLAANE
ncbi:MAG: peroxiredoxin [Kiritimatiellia bacterium]|nr:peroxiredoxin [Kiritimatiellia bacterium]MDP6811345.1 peroxiredoxin [Kiritimatiellia bacterium]MDP7024386.1 peroxiredoxin [Kiritimatiellia bacterium]